MYFCGEQTSLKEKLVFLLINNDKGLENIYTKHHKLHFFFRFKYRYE